jgi:hypothetical protein
MATSRKIQITTENTGLWHCKQSEAAAKKTSELLQEDLEVSELLRKSSKHPDKDVRLKIFISETPLFL